MKPHTFRFGANGKPLAATGTPRRKTRKKIPMSRATAAGRSTADYVERFDALNHLKT